MMSGLSEWFWQERLWFPEGLGWADLEDRDGRVYAKARDLWVALPIALVFLIIRQIFERSVHFSHCLTRYLCPSSSMSLVINSNICFPLFTNFPHPSVQSNSCLCPLTATFSSFPFSPLVCPSIISCSDLWLHYFTPESSLSFAFFSAVIWYSLCCALSL